MGSIILIAFALLPVFAIGYYMYKKDPNKEPTNLLIKLFLCGIGSTILVLIISYILYIIFPFFAIDKFKLNLIDLIPSVFIGVALIEEFCKWIFVYKVSYNNKEFDEFYDILLYSAFVALGFAGFENILYVSSSGLYTALIRAITAVPGHAFFGIYMGYYLGLAKINSLNGRKEIEKKNIILSIVVPLLMHGIYDYLSYAMAITGNFIYTLIWIVFVIALYIYCIMRIMKVSKLTGRFINNNNINNNINNQNINTNNNINYNYNNNYQVNNQYCTKCGKIVSGNFCTNCGNRNN